MKFVPRDLGEASEASSGGGSREALRETGRLLLWGLGLLVGLYLAIGLGTDLALRGISVEREKTLFADFDLSGLKGALPVELEPAWARAERVLERLRTADGVPDFNYTLIYSPQTDPNAFAVPGGRIVLTRGLLEGLAEEDSGPVENVADESPTASEIAVAFVLGHELGHFAHRDHLRGIGRRVGLKFALGLVFGGGGDGLVKMSSDLLLLHYSRDQERAADAFALETLRATYGRTDGAERLFALLVERDTLPAWAYMFATHPDTRERLRALEDQAASG